MYMGELALPTKTDLWAAIVQKYVPQYSKEVAVLTGAQPTVVQPVAAQAAASAPVKPPMSMGTKIAIGGGVLGAIGLLALALRGRGRSR